MLRYIIGISLVTVFILLIRKYSDGKILKRHQYALWLLIPAFMIIFPTARINVQVPEALRTEQTEIVVKKDTDVAAADSVQTDKEQQAVFTEAVQDDNVLNTVSELSMSGLLKLISLSVSALLILAFAIYNIGFVIYCRHRRSFIRKDRVSGLKVYAVSHKGAPFLLFNKIYVYDEADADNKHIIYHEAAHHKHGDTFWNILRYLVLALNWYNPFIWAAFIMSGVDCELACDEEVLRTYIGKEYSADYAMALYEKTRQQSELEFGFTVSSGLRSEYKTMKKRIAGIKSPAKKNYLVLSLCTALLFMFSGCILIDPDKTVSADKTDWSSSSASDTLLGVPLSKARIRLSNSTIAPMVFEADERTVNELSKAVSENNGDNGDMRIVFAVDYISMDLDTGERLAWENDLSRKGTYAFINYNGECFQLFFDDEGCMESLEEGAYSPERGYDPGFGSTFIKCANREDPSIYEDRMIPIPPFDFTPEGVWKYDTSVSVVRGFQDYLTSWPEGVWK